MTFKARLDKLESDKGQKAIQHIFVDLINSTFKINNKDQGPYEPSATGKEFHDDDSFVRLIVGPYGSGKSTMCCAEMLFRTCAMPPCNDGVRRSKWGIVRNTYGDLTTTSVKTWLQWFYFLGKTTGRKTPRMEYTHTFNDGNGIVELNLLFIALDRPDQLRALKSLELSGVYINEACEVPGLSFSHFKARVNKRYPSKRDCPHDYWAGIIADTNPPDTDHWMYDLFEVRKPEGYKIFHQPPGLLKLPDGTYEENPEADNIKHLGAGSKYYLDMLQGESEEFIKVYILGQYGTVVDGKFVYDNYNDDLHSEDLINIWEDEAILLSWDYGTVSPACLITQFVESRVYVIKEFVCEYMTPKELYEASVKPFLAKYCKGLPMECIGDPADTYDGREQLEECGLPMQAAATNNLDARIRSVRDLLNSLIKGKPRIIISKQLCPKLRQGLLGKYQYKRLKVVGEERYKDVPDKNHPYSDVQDCLQYAALHYLSFDVREEEELIYPRDLIADDGGSKVGGY